MDSQPRSVQFPSEEVACDYRPVRHFPKLQMSGVLCTYERLYECGDRCFPPELGGPSGLCIPSIQYGEESPQQSEGVPQSRANSDRSLLASEGVVPGSAGGPSGATLSVANEERSTQTAPFSPLSHGAPIASASCLETVWRFSRHEGFSRGVANQLTFSRRPSTQAVYQAKWNVYRRWCERHERSISNPTLPKVADFLLFLFNRKHLSVSAIKGYRSMLSFVFHSKLPVISNSKVLSDLIKSFSLQRPPHREPKLSWDLNKILSVLRASPFEPLHNIPIRNLTQKCLFLIALATAKRVSEIHALSFEVGKQGQDLILSYLPHFLAKTESDSNPLPRSFPLKSLGDFVGDLREELLVCPVRCLLAYIKRTSNIQSRPKSLFLSPGNPSRAISKNGISFFLRELISNYGLLGAQEGLAPRAHSIRSMATSLAFKKNIAIPRILEAATWRSNSVFASFYLKDVAIEFGDLWRLGPLVVAGQVL